MGNLKKIVLDPGHGGRDPGACANGLQEKALVLAVCLKIRDRLRAHGIDVFMTRESGVLPMTGGSIAQDLSYRASLANRAGADLFVSWHADSGGASANGLSTFIYTQADQQTKQWAAIMQEELINATGATNRGVRTDDFCVVRETAMPAMLVESGFITNPTEAARLASNDYQVSLAEGAVKAICRMFSIKYVPPINAQAVQEVVNLLGLWWQETEDAETRTAFHATANHLRGKIGQPRTAPLEDVVTRTGAEQAIWKCGEAWKVADRDEIRDVLHTAANYLRQRVGMPLT